MAEKTFMSAEEVAQEMECSKTYAYGIIKKLNAELEEKGFLVMKGKVNRRYFHERTYKGDASSNLGTG